MKKHFYYILPCVLATILFTSHIDVSAQNQNDIGVINGRIVNVTEPINDKDVANKKYVDDSIAMIPEPPVVLQTLGQSTSGVLSQKAVTDLIWPVGSIYMSVNNANPGVLFGGTWEAIENRFLIGASSSYVAETIGGNASISLDAGNLPSHTHSFSATTSSTGGHEHTIGRDYDGGSGTNRWTVHNAGVSGAGGTSPTSNTGNHSHSVSGTTGSTGNNAPFSILPPYLAVYIWKRTA